MSTPESSLPEAWVRRIWDTMRATYGAAFDRQWECPAGVAPEAHVQNLMATWGRGLAQLQQNPKAIAYGLDNLPEHPPNLPQFRALCNRRPDKPQQALPAPKADPARVQQALAGIGRGQSARDPLQTLRELAESDARDGTYKGRKVTLAQRQTYRQALGMDRGNTPVEGAC